MTEQPLPQVVVDERMPPGTLAMVGADGTVHTIRNISTKATTMPSPGFSTWRGQNPELTCPPTVRARFHPNEMVYPTFEFELNGPAFRLLRDLVEKARSEAGEHPSDEMVALAEAFAAIGD